jgi:3-phytase
VRTPALATGGLLTALLCASVGDVITADGVYTAGFAPGRYRTGRLRPPPRPPRGRTATVVPTVETDPSHGSGDTADDMAIWVHPSDPSLSLVIGDDKDGGLMVWGLDGKELQYVEGTKYSNVDLRYNFPLAGRFSSGTAHQAVALVGVGDESGRRVDFFKVNPGTRRLEPAGSIHTANRLVPYGSCMYHSAVNGKYHYFVNAKSGVVQQWQLHDGGSGQVAGTLVRTFDVGSQPEGCVADDVLATSTWGRKASASGNTGPNPVPATPARR